MKLIQQTGNIYKGKPNYKYIVVLPIKLIRTIKWKKGQNLNATIKNNRIIITKD